MLAEIISFIVTNLKFFYIFNSVLILTYLFRIKFIATNSETSEELIYYLHIANVVDNIQNLRDA